MNAQIGAVQLQSWSFRSTLAVVICAGIGGMLPTAVKLAPAFATAQPPSPEPGLYLGFFLYFVVGAVVALLYRETDFRKAIILGIAAPGIVTNLIAGTDQAGVLRKTQAETQQQSALLESWPAVLGIGAAHARTRGASQAIPRSSPQRAQLTVVPDLRGSEANYAVPPVRIAFLSRDGRTLTSTTVDPRTTTQLSVPAGAASVRADAGGRWGDTDLPRGPYASADLRLKVEFGRPNDFLWALGQTRKARIDNVDVSVANVRPVNAPIDKGTVVLSTDGTQLGVVDSVRRAPGRPQAVVVEPEA
jgi:hypothetical protein